MIDLVSALLVAAGVLVIGFVCGWKGRGAIERHVASCPQCRRRLIVDLGVAGRIQLPADAPAVAPFDAKLDDPRAFCEHERPMNRWCGPCGRNTAHLFRPATAAAELSQCRRCGAPAMELSNLCADCSRAVVRGDA